MVDVAVGDLDGDGDLDIAYAQESGPRESLWRNDGEFRFTSIQTLGFAKSSTVAIADMDGDGDLDILEDSEFWRNDGLLRFRLAGRIFSRVPDGVATGDFTSDGVHDAFMVDYSGSHWVFLGIGGGQSRHHISVAHPGPTDAADFFASPYVTSANVIPIDYKLYHPAGKPVGRVEVQYSLDGGGQWRLAVPTDATQTTLLAASPAGAAHVFYWDTYRSGFLGQGDHVVLRLRAIEQTPTRQVGSFGYVNATSEPTLWPQATTVTFPFRVRGTQVRVYRDTIAEDHVLAGSLVWRLPQGQTLGASPIGDDQTLPYRTDRNGYLPGRGTLNVGDQLIALWPAQTLDTHTLYYTSAAVTTAGLDLTEVEAPGVQNLLVSERNPLAVFDLDIALEWDSSQDAQYMSQLRFDLHRAGNCSSTGPTVRQHWADCGSFMMPSKRQSKTASSRGAMHTFASMPPIACARGPNREGSSRTPSPIP